MAKKKRISWFSIGRNIGTTIGLVVGFAIGTTIGFAIAVSVSSTKGFLAYIPGVRPMLNRIANHRVFTRIRALYR